MGHDLISGTKGPLHSLDISEARHLRELSDSDSLRRTDDIIHGEIEGRPETGYASGSRTVVRSEIPHVHVHRDRITL